jgi:hypothetical protein
MLTRVFEGIVLAAILLTIFVGFDLACYAWDTCAFVEGMR